MEKIPTTARLKALRRLMLDRNIEVYVIPSEDSHQSEYIAPCDARREFISGFSGSAGIAIVSQTAAALSTDGRYFNQAEQQLDDNWTLLKEGLKGVPTWQKWTAQQSSGNKIVAVDPTLITTSGAHEIENAITQEGGSKLLAVKENLVDLVWGSDRPSRPHEKINPLPLIYAGVDVKTKLQNLRKKLVEEKSRGIVISLLDEIAWLFNLRGRDIPYNPVFFSYAFVSQNAATLYVDERQVSEDVYKNLVGLVEFKPYTALINDLEGLAATVDPLMENTSSKFLISNRASWALHQSLGGDLKVRTIRSPIGDAKAVKNTVELSGMRNCHIRDGAALIAFFAWLENKLLVENAKVTEIEASDRLESFRAEQEHFIGLSFDTISSTGSNAAVIHYKAQPGFASTIDKNKIYLCDSGGQYLDGTTDTTRTLHFGEPTAKEILAYTLVLKGHIALDRARFPKGVSGFPLDVMARQYLWEHGLDYRHGTGHGVGSYLNVHEGPIGVGMRPAYNDVPFEPGHVLSNEPGYYEDGKFGIRIENVMTVREVKTEYQFGEKPFFGFEHVTMVPMCRKLIEKSLLTGLEVSWLNAYHQEVRSKTLSLLQNNKLAMDWSQRETAPI